MLARHEFSTNVVPNLPFVSEINKPVYRNLIKSDRSIINIQPNYGHSENYELKSSYLQKKGMNASQQPQDTTIEHNHHIEFMPAWL